MDCKKHITRLPSPYETMSLIDVPGIQNQFVIEKLKKEGVHTPTELMEKYLKFLYDNSNDYPFGKFCGLDHILTPTRSVSVNDAIAGQLLAKVLNWAADVEYKMEFGSRKV